MNKLRYLAVLVAVVACLAMPSVAVPDGGIEATVDVLIQTEGSADLLVNQIESSGGTIRFHYRNVPAVAASVPASQMQAVMNVAGVTKIEKDGMVYLDEGPEGTSEVRPRSRLVEGAGGIEVEAVDVAALDLNTLPEGYAAFLYTNADTVWDEGNFGQGTIVAVVDTGVTPNICLSHAVIGAPGFPDGYNSTGDGIPATSPTNYWHGTHVAGLISSSCALTVDPSNPLAQAVLTHLGWPSDFIPILGQAPLAEIYPVKVFPQSGAGVPTSIILDGLDHVLTLKKTEVLDIDIVNMSLGGPSLWDGRDMFDRFINELTKANIMTVTSAGNEGPVPNSVGSPGTACDSLSVGALDYAPSSRTFYEYLGLAIWPGAPGQGLVMRPTDEVRVVNFSSRGPLSDGRAGPDIVALGHWSFAAGPNDELRWAGGTSFSSPIAAGAAALLNTWWEGQGKETDPQEFSGSLVAGANAQIIGSLWRGRNDRGWGAVDAAKALTKLKAGISKTIFKYVPLLRHNILGWPVEGKVKTWESDTITLMPSERINKILRVEAGTSKVTIEVFDITAPDNSAYAFWPNALEVHVQSAKRTSFSHPIEQYWYPYFSGDAFSIEVEDGPWTFAGAPIAYQPMEPGLMKVTMIGDYSNEAAVSFKLRITREDLRQFPFSPIAKGPIGMGDSVVIPVDIPAGVALATFDLDWARKWDRFPTSDIDMIIFDPDFNLASLAGATGNAPERALIESPAAGTWYVLVDGYEMYRRDTYKLYLNLQ